MVDLFTKTQSFNKINQLLSMEQISQILLILIPASLVLFGMYITVRSMIIGQNETKQIESKAESRKISLPMQLQAYERICLLLERISLQNILVRLNGKAINVGDFQQVLVSEIREEFNHNLSQQVYMSDAAWEQVKNTVEQTIGIVNEAANGLDTQANGIELSKKILNKVLTTDQNFNQNGLSFIKNEARTKLWL
jgi:hypothetical protein